MDYFMCYIWADSDNPNECKFGDHFVSGVDSLAEAEADTQKYVRSSLGRQKHKYDDGRIKIHHMWDVSEYAKSRKCFKKHGKVDDKLRGVIDGYISGDFHKTPVEDAIYAVSTELARLGQPLPVAGLSPNQYYAAEDVLSAKENGHRTILAELCARFGKTIWAGALISETEVPLTIVAFYVQTVGASFKVDLSSFEQFKNFVQVDTKASDYQEQIDAALAEGKQVVAYLSLCSGKSRQARVDYLFGLDVERMVIVDEADFGAHTPAQAKLLINARQDSDTVVLMTGTNADKAASEWNVDHMLSVTYPELLMEKKLHCEA